MIDANILSRLFHYDAIVQYEGFVMENTLPDVALLYNLIETFNYFFFNASEHVRYTGLLCM